MEFFVNYECNGITYPVLNGQKIRAKSARGLKRAFSNMIQKRAHVLGLWYGHGVKITATAENATNGTVCASCTLSI